MQYVQYFDIIMIEWLASRISWLGNGIRTEKLMKMGWKRWFCVEAVG